jgi:uncharacterized protein YciI
MAKKQFFFRLIPPRSTFVADMTDGERALMVEHAAYLHGHFEQGSVLAYGPVLDPAGAFGIALFEVDELAQAERIAEGDPTILAGLNTYSIVPMVVSASRAAHASE